MIGSVYTDLVIPNITSMLRSAAVQPASYIVYTDGSRYYAKNGSTGMVEYSDTDATKVIQYAIDKTVEKGYWGTVLLRAGIYYLTDTIYLWAGVGLVGEKHGWYRVGTGEYTGTILWGNINKPVIKVAVHPNYVGSDPNAFSVYKCFPYIAKIAIFGSNNQNYGANNGIEITSEAGIYDFVMTGVLVGYVGGSGLYVNNQYVKIWITQSYFEYNYQHGVYANLAGLIAINEAYIAYNKGNGVHIDSWGTIFISNSAIQYNQQGVVARGGYVYISSSNIVSNYKDGVYIARLTYPVYVIVTGSMIANNGDGTSTYSNLRIDSERAVVAGNIIMENRSPAKTSYHVDMRGGTLVVEGNLFHGTPANGIINQTAGTLLARDNIGLTTVNTGVATISAGSVRVTVNHGLVKSPSKVFITPLAQPPGRLWVENITSTSFDIVTDTAPATNLNVSWQAEV